MEIGKEVEGRESKGALKGTSETLTLFEHANRQKEAKTKNSMRLVCRFGLY